MKDAQALAELLRELDYPFKHAHQDPNYLDGYRHCDMVECLHAGIDGLFVLIARGHIDVGPPPVDSPDGSPEWEGWLRAMRSKEAAAHPTLLVPLRAQRVRSMLRALTPLSARQPRPNAAQAAVAPRSAERTTAGAAAPLAATSWVCPDHGTTSVVTLTSRRGRVYGACNVDDCEEFEE